MLGRLTAAQLARARGEDKPKPRKPVPAPRQAAEIPASFMVILYDPKDPIFPPPHRTVLDAYRTRDMHRYNWKKVQEAEEEHQACLAGQTEDPPLKDYGGGRTEDRTDWNTCTHDEKCRVHGLAYCAACDWTDPEIHKARAKKKAILDLFLRTGKITGWAGATYPSGDCYTKRARMTDAEARRIVLPRCDVSPLAKPVVTAAALMAAWGPFEAAEDQLRRYLTAMGSKLDETKDGVEFWTCGCTLRKFDSYNSRERELASACPKHQRALQGRDDD